MAVLLELARVLVSDQDISLPGPLLFLFNGGEETLMQASHGFVHSGHVWAKDIGSFINLEATGSGGPDTLFQHTADWTVKTYAAAAKYPRGSVFLMVQIPWGPFFIILLALSCLLLFFSYVTYAFEYAFHGSAMLICVVLCLNQTFQTDVMCLPAHNAMQCKAMQYTAIQYNEILACNNSACM